jgi:sugar phosphate isomerase/epimerase
MADSVHVGDTPQVAAEVARHAARITGLHAADKLAPGDPERVLPGEGSTHPERFVQLVRRSGFDGYLDIEIFSTDDAFWGLPVSEAAARAAAAARSLIAQS